MSGYKVIPQKLSPAEFKTIVDIVKFWGPEQKKIVGKLMRHNAWLDEQRMKVEQELREFRQLKIDDSIVKSASTPPRTFFTAKENTDIRYTSKGHRFYDFLRTQPESSFDAFLRWNSVTFEQALEIANNYASETGKELIHARQQSSHHENLDP